MKLLILNDGRKYENWGIKACFDGLGTIFKDHTIETVEHADLHRLFNIDPMIRNRRLFNEQSRIQKRFFKEYLRTPVVADGLEYFCDEWSAGRGGPGSAAIIEKMKKSDIVIFNGEGSTYRKNVGAFRSLFLLYFAKTRLNKRAYFLNGSVTLASVDATLPGMVEMIFPVLDGVYVREPLSKGSIEDYTGFRSAAVVPDSVFALDQAQFNEAPLSGFCFSLSMLPMQRYPLNSNNAIVQMLAPFSKKFGACTFLAKDVEDQYLRSLAKYMESGFAGADKTYPQIEETLARTNLLISGRYHHLIFALRQGCPVVPLKSSSHKIDGLIKLFDGLLPEPLDPTNLLHEQPKLEKIIEDLSDPGLRRKIYDRATEIQGTVRGLASIV